MPDAPAEMVDVILPFSSGVSPLTKSLLSSILSLVYRRKSNSGALMVIWDASPKI